MPLHLALLCGLLTVAADKPAKETNAHLGLPNAFFAMDTATKDEKHQTLESQLEMVKKLGFAGYAMHADAGVPQAVEIAERLKIKVFAIYAGVDVDAKDSPWQPTLPDVIRKLKGRSTEIWLQVTSSKHRSTSGEADDIAAGMIRRVADMAADSGLRVSLYPHHGFYMADSSDALRLAKLSKRDNVKITFNLCHWLMTEHGKDLDGVLKRTLPYLSIVNINGADKAGNDWGRLIQPLGDGAFDVYDLLVRLRKMGYQGPVGLQGYGIKGDVNVHLAQAMKTWKDYQKRLAAEKP